MAPDKRIQLNPLSVFKFLALSVIVMVLIFGVYLKGEVAGEASKCAVKQAQTVCPKTIAGNVPDDTATASSETASDTVLVDGFLKVTADTDRTTFEVWNYGKKVGEINRDYSSDITLMKRSDGFAYLGLSPNGLGGYILFSGPEEVYKLDEDTLAKVYEGRERNGFVSDVVGNKLVAVENPVAEGAQASIVIYDLATQKPQASYPIPPRYSVAGAAHLSQSGDRLVYEAAIGSPDNEEYAMYMIDLKTGKQTPVGGVENFE